MGMETQRQIQQIKDKALVTEIDRLIKSEVEKRGFHRWAWLVVLLLGGVLMLFGGAQDMAIFFSPDSAPIPAWHSVPSPVVGLICGLIVLVSAGSNIIRGWQLRHAVDVQEQNLARLVAFVSAAAMIADWISGYYGFGSLMALLTGIWLIRKLAK